MGDFKVDPDYKLSRKASQKKSQRRQNIILSVIVICFIIISAIVVVSLFSASNSIETVTPPPDTEQTTPSTTDVAPGTSASKTDEPSANPTLTSAEPTETTQSRPVRHTTTIYIDAGHGALSLSGSHDVGTGSGTFYHTLSGGKYEDDLNLEIALKLQKILEDAGYAVVMTRTGKIASYVSLEDRAELANNSESSVFVSIHGNSFDNASACGTRIYYYQPRSDADECKDLANAIKSQIDITPHLSQKSASVYNGDYAVLRLTKMPAVLIETCFLTNEEDAKKAIDDNWQMEMARAISNGIISLYPLRITYE